MSSRLDDPYLKLEDLVVTNCISTGSTFPVYTSGTGTAIPSTFPTFPTFPTAGSWSIAPGDDCIQITDENGLPKNLSVTEVSRLYADALEYRRILRFAKIFESVKTSFRDLLIVIKLSDPYNEKELKRLEEELEANSDR